MALRALEEVLDFERRELKGESMFEKLEEVERRYESSTHLLGQPEVISNQDELQKVAREFSELGKIVELYRKLKKLDEEIQGSRDLLATEEDEEMKRMAKEEVHRLYEEKEKVEEDLRLSLLPKDPNDEKNMILEIRAGTGGDEAGLFAAELFRMYSKFAERRQWKIEVLNRHYSGVGGFKEIIAPVEGKGRLQPVEIRKRRPSRSEGARHRIPGPHPHLDGDRGHPSGGRRRGRRDRPQ